MFKMNKKGIDLLEVVGELLVVATLVIIFFGVISKIPGNHIYKEKTIANEVSYIKDLVDISKQPLQVNYEIPKEYQIEFDEDASVVKVKSKNIPQIKNYNKNQLSKTTITITGEINTKIVKVSSWENR